VLVGGTYLAQRWQDDGSINLYYLPGESRGLFAKVGVDNSKEQAVVLRSFSDSEPLEDYAHGVRLLGE
jgi:hypothetical protein